MLSSAPTSNWPSRPSMLTSGSMNLEVDLDQMVINVIARRQPTAGDLRMITGVAKVIDRPRAHGR